jgi:hypothetical protein
LQRPLENDSGLSSLDRLLRRISEPNDVDVFMIMDDNLDVGSLRGETAILFDHLAAQAHFGCSVFWLRKMAAFGGEQSAIEDWQIKRDGTLRGIVEITGRKSYVS